MEMIEISVTGDKLKLKNRPEKLYADVEDLIVSFDFDNHAFASAVFKSKPDNARTVVVGEIKVNGTTVCETGAVIPSECLTAGSWVEVCVTLYSTSNHTATSTDFIPIGLVYKRQSQEGPQPDDELPELELPTNVYEELIKHISPIKIDTIELEASSWKNTDTDSCYVQEVWLENITENSQVDLKPDAELLAVLLEKNLALTTETVGPCRVNIYAIGDKPTQDYTIQVSITEVKTD